MSQFAGHFFLSARQWTEALSTVSRSSLAARKPTGIGPVDCAELLITSQPSQLKAKVPWISSPFSAPASCFTECESAHFFPYFYQIRKIPHSGLSQAASYKMQWDQSARTNLSSATNLVLADPHIEQFLRSSLSYAYVPGLRAMEVPTRLARAQKPGLGQAAGCWPSTLR